MDNKKYLSLGTIKKTAIAGLLALIIGCQSPYIPPPAPPAPPDTNELSTDTHVLSGDEDAKISSVSDNYITTSNPSSYSVGEIIVSDITDQTPDGLLRKVTPVSGNIVYTQPSTFEEAVKNVSFEATKSIKIKAKRSPSKDITLINVNYPITNFPVYDENGDNVNDNDEIVLNGDVSFNSNLNFKLEIENNQIKKFAFYNTNTESAHFSLTSYIENQNLSLEDIVYSLNKISPFTLGYLPTTPPLPVIVKPVVNIVAGLQGGISFVNGIGLKQDASLTLGLSYENGSWTPTINPTCNFDFQSPEISGINSLKGYAGPVVNFLFYGIAGPYVKLDGYLKLNLESDSLNLYGGLEGTLGVDGRVLGQNFANYSLPIFITEKLLHSWTKPVPPPTTTLNIQPNQDNFIDLSQYYGGGPGRETGSDYPFLEIDRYYGAKGNDVATSFIEFPLSSIPPDANIVSSKLKLFGVSMSDSSYYNGVSVGVRKITQSWNEHFYDNGPSYDTTDISSVILSGGSKWYEWDVTSMVKDWINGQPNYGLAIVSGNRTAGDWNTNEFLFYSRDSSDSSTKPILEIEYTTP